MAKSCLPNIIGGTICHHHLWRSPDGQRWKNRGKAEIPKKKRRFPEIVYTLLYREHIDILYNYIHIIFLFQTLGNIQHTLCDGETIVEYLPQFTIAQLGIWDHWTQWFIP